MDAFDFQLPDNAPPDMVAIAQLGAAISELTATVDALHQQHLQLRDAVAAGRAGPVRPADGPGVPWPLRWDEMDRDQAAQAWAWLIGWVDWLVDRYQLPEEIPVCWYRHPPLIDELTALAAAWHAAYDDNATVDAPLLWLERFARARDRLRAWDDATRCRNGTHTDRHVELAWPDAWRDTVVETVNTDLDARRPADATAAGERA
jgi:hypothetical protein